MSAVVLIVLINVIQTHNVRPYRLQVVFFKLILMYWHRFSKREGDEGMIIVPIDDSSHSLNALDFAVSMAQKYDEILLLLNVQSKKETPLSSKIGGGENLEEEKLAYGEKQLQKATALVSGKAAYDTKVRLGIPSIEITKEAKEINATCIVMGSRGNGPVVSAILGSVSYGVLHLSPCPVTVVPGRGDRLE